MQDVMVISELVRICVKDGTLEDRPYQWLAGFRDGRVEDVSKNWIPHPAATGKDLNLDEYGTI